MIFYPAMSAQVNSMNPEHSSGAGREALQSDLQPSNTASNPNDVGNLRAEDITVALDYQPPPDSSYFVDTSTPGRDSPPTVSRRHRSDRYEYTIHQGRFRRRRRRQDESFLRFYSKHWFGQCIAALLTGVIFMSIGIVFVTTGVTSPYIGVMFMLVSLPSFFMSLHMIRSRIRQQRLRRIYLARQRRRMARRRRRRARNEDSAYRSNALPHADLPPSYDNLGYTANEYRNADERMEPDAISMGTSSDVSEGPPPSYDNEWEKDSLELDMEIEEDEGESYTVEKGSPSSNTCEVTMGTPSSQVPTCSRRE